MDHDVSVAADVKPVSEAESSGEREDHLWRVPGSDQELLVCGAAKINQLTIGLAW